ncbi:MAG: hypothetical protein Q8K75_03155 [Chlamydiales bacterium]|nr:hypothetical protein [Chlamydiales bacterium]
MLLAKIRGYLLISPPMIAKTHPTELNQPFMALLKPIREHLDLISMTISTVANAVFLAGKLFTQVPSRVTRSAFVALNVVGFLYLDWQVSFTIKTARDSLLALKLKVWHIAILTAVCTVNAISDMALMTAGLAAALASWASRPEVATAIYTVTRPWGISFLFVAIAMDVSYYALRRSVACELKDLNSSRRFQNIFSALVGKARRSNGDDVTAVKIRASMDKYTLETLLNKLQGRFDPTVLMKQVKENVNTQLDAERNNLGLRAIGYAGLFLCKAYPDSLVQAITLFATSLLYTANNAYKKWHEARQRDVILS